MTTADREYHGTVYFPCVPLGTITVTPFDTAQYGRIASVDLGDVGIHVHTAARARELADAGLKALEILDPDGLAELRMQILGERIIELLDEDPAPVSVVPTRFAPLAPVAPLRTCAKCHVTGPEGQIVTFDDAHVHGMQWLCADAAGCCDRAAELADVPVFIPECSECGIADPIRVSETGKCWNSARCDERVAANAGYAVPQVQGIIPAGVLTDVVNANARLLGGGM